MKVKNWLFIICLMIPVFCFSKQNSDDLIRKMQKKFKASESERIDFVEVYRWKLTGEEASLSGKIWLKGEDQFHIETEDQTIVSDGKTLWTYSKPANRVLIDDLAKSDDALLPNQLLLKYTDNYQSVYIGEEEIHQNKCHLIELSSITQDTYIPKVRLWLNQSSNLPLMVEQTDLHGNQTIFKDLSIQLNIAVNDTLFRYSIPEGAQIIKMTK